MNKKTEILKQAVDAFRLETGLEIEVRERDVKLDRTQVDAVVELQGKPCTTYYAEIKNWVAQAHLGTVVDRLLQLPEPRLLVADYVNRKLALRLKERGIQYIDTAGNAYIDQLPLYINVRGNDRLVTLTTAEHRTNYRLNAEPGQYKIEVGRPAMGRAFTPTGLKVVYVLLTELNAISAPYREIAKKADVALGTVGWVINDLKARGLVFERGKKKKIGNYQKLLELWTEAYALNLRLKLLVAELFHEDPYWWEKVDIRGFDGKWGGETAAARLTNNLKPVTTTIYLRGELAPLVQKTRLRRRQNATDVKVEILQPFWPKNQMDENKDTVDQLLVYADLVNTADPRNIETAQLVLEHYFDQHI